MDSLSLCNKIHETIHYLKPFLPLINCHMVNYIKGNMFEKLVPKEFKEEVKVMNTEDIKSLFLRSFNGENIEDQDSSEFVKYLLNSRKMYLQFNGVGVNFEILKEIFASRGYGTLRSLHLDQFMSIKKSHEVEVMSAVANVMAINTKCSHIVDIGGGKGYLSSMLALEHKFKVLCIDASKINSIGALKRTNKLKANEETLRKTGWEEPEFQEQSKLLTTLAKNVIPDHNLAYDLRKGEETKEKNAEGSCRRSNIRTLDFKKVWSGIRKKLPKNDAAELHLDSKQQSAFSNIPSEGSLKQSTEFITEDSQILQMVNEYYPDDICKKLMIVGLHTCGNLSPTSLRLFVKNSEFIGSLINVGCCYHLIDEEFETSSFWTDVNMEVSSFGFPMSNYLQNQQFTIGRNSRMLASQSLDRIADEEKFNTEPLFYRALLEIYLQEKLGVQDVPRSRVGRLTNKSLNFTDYVHKSLKKLEIDNIEIDDANIEEFYKNHKLDQELLQKFFIIRIVLAPVVEALILMDRLLYLLEQGVEDVFIAQLFNPVVSPRCYAIVAFNNCK